MLLRRHRENVVPQADEPQKEAVKVVEATEAVAEPTPQPQTVEEKPKRRTTKKG